LKAQKRRSPRSLAVSDAFKTYVLDQLGDVGDITAKSMFGGVGLYHNGVFFGILAHDKLYLKVGAVNVAEYERVGMAAFRASRSRRGTSRYREVPVSILESPIDLAVWARKAIAVATADRR